MLGVVAAVIAVLAGCAPATTTPATAPATTTSATKAASASCRGTGSTATRDVAYRRVAGVDPNLLSLDTYRPIRPAGCGAAPIVVYVHGGGFRIGDKVNKVEDKAALFTGEGWLFASVNYRLSPNPPSDLPGQVRYPTHGQDVAVAIAWLKGHSAELGGDPERIFLLGHSSGAFLVSLISTDTSFLAAAGLSTSDVRCTAALDTEYDVSDQIAEHGSQQALYRNAFGDDPAVWNQGSPANHTAAGTARPRFLIYTRGAPRRIAQARGLASSLLAGGTPASAIDVSPLGHDDVNLAVGAPGETKVTPPLIDFLRACASDAAATSHRGT